MQEPVIKKKRRANGTVKRYKPDLVCIAEDEPGDGKIILIDVAVPYEDRADVMDNVAEENPRSMSGLKRNIEGEF